MADIYGWKKLHGEKPIGLHVVLELELHSTAQVIMPR